MTTNKQTTSKIDYSLVLILFLLFISSCIAIYSAQTTGQYNENFLLKQIVWYAIGIGLVAIVITIDSDQLKKISWYVYGFGLVLLAFLIVAPDSIAPVINGAKSWYKVPGMGSLQPSEFVKVFLILALSRVIVEHRQKNQVKTIQTDLWLLFKLGIVTLASTFVGYATTGFRDITCIHFDFAWNGFYIWDFMEDFNHYFRQCSCAHFDGFLFCALASRDFRKILRCKGISIRKNLFLD